MEGRALARAGGRARAGVPAGKGGAVRPGEDVFRFRRFAVRHGGAALRLGTDAVMLGAWCGVRPGMRRILDAGAGCGVLALMAAQRTEAATCGCGEDFGPPRGPESGGFAGPDYGAVYDPGFGAGGCPMPDGRNFAGCRGAGSAGLLCGGPAVDAVELDPVSAALAAENFAASPWAGRMRVWQGPLQEFPGECREITLAETERFEYIAGANAVRIPVGRVPAPADVPEKETPRAGSDGLREKEHRQKAEGRVPAEDMPRAGSDGLPERENMPRARKRLPENESDIPGKGLYDLVVSNPPWFEGTTCSPKQRRAAARHGIAMTYADLATAAFGLLGAAGRLSAVVPYTERCRMLEAAWACGFALEREAEVCTAAGKPAVRSLMEFTKGPAGEAVRERFCIADESGAPSARWRELTGAFYPPRRDNGK